MSLRPPYLLDTNICIYLMKHQPPQVAQRFSSRMVGEVLISAITAAELGYGVVVSGEDADLNRAAMDPVSFARCPSLRSMLARPGSTAWCGWQAGSDGVTRSSSRSPPTPLPSISPS